MPMPLRSLRIEDELWWRAMDRATREGVSLSAMIREWLEEYAKDEEKERKE